MKALVNILAVLLIIVSAVLIHECKEQPTTIETSKIKYDTIYVPPPPPEIKEVDTYKEHYFDLVDVVNSLRDSLSNNEPSVRIDTITQEVKVYVPIKTYRFKTEEFDTQIKGYDVEMVSMIVYPKTVYETKVKEVTKQSKFSLGLQVGYGIGLANPAYASPYIGLGISYNLINF